jgi:hypothetical protein
MVYFCQYWGDENKKVLHPGAKTQEWEELREQVSHLKVDMHGSSGQNKAMAQNHQAVGNYMITKN